jgi:MFS family permease
VTDASPAALTRRRGLPAAVAFWLLAYAFAINMMGTTLPTPLYPLYQEQLGFNQLMVTIIFAVYAVGVIAGLLLFGRLSDQVGRRRALMPGLALSAASAVVFLLEQDLALLFAGRILSGLSAGIFTGTATAALLDLAPRGDRGRATLVASATNMLGLGLGPILAGALAQFGPDELRLVFMVDLALLVPAAWAVWAMPETVTNPTGFRLRPERLYVPAEVRRVFVPAAIAGFAGFSVLGLLTAVTAAFLGGILHNTSHLLSGAVVTFAFVGSGLGQLALELTSIRVAMRAGCAVLMAGMVVLGVALQAESLALLITGALVAGFGQGLTFRAALAGLGQASPPEQRATVASTFFVVAYVAISLPVVGEGIAAHVTDLRTAATWFTGLVLVLAGVALGLLLRLGDQPSRS